MNLGEIYFEDWGPGWTALSLTVVFGVYLVTQSARLIRARQTLETRILVTGSRGKSGTIRILHALFLSNQIPVYSKITGTTAVELFPDGSEKPTVRRGAAGIPEMKSAVLRSQAHEATVGVFESMAVTPKLIELVDRIIKPHIGVIPTIRLDHTEEEGLTELEIGENILYSIRRCQEVFVAVDQPEIISRYKEMALEYGINIHFVSAAADQPNIPGQHPTNVALTIAVANHLGLNWQGIVQRCTLEPEANIFHRLYHDGQLIELYDISGANDPQSAREAFQNLPISKDRLVIPVVVNRWARPQRGVIFSAVFEQFEPFVLRVGTQKRGNRNPGERQQNYIPLGPERLINLDTLSNFLNSKLPEENKPNIALVLFSNVHEPSADRIRDLFQKHGEVLEQVSD